MSAHSVPIDGPAGAEAAPVSATTTACCTTAVYLGMVMFLGSETMLFGSFFTVFFFLRFTQRPWPPTGIDAAEEADRASTPPS